jgi:hypothetical protein
MKFLLQYLEWQEGEIESRGLAMNLWREDGLKNNIGKDFHIQLQEQDECTLLAPGWAVGGGA